MATSLSAAQTWVHDPSLFNIATVDLALRSDGTLALAFAGTGSTLDGYLAYGTLNTASGQASGVVSTTYVQATGGLPFLSMGQIDLVAGPGGRVAALLPMNESGLTGDTNAALLVQRFADGGFAGTGVPVNPARLLTSRRPIRPSSMGPRAGMPCSSPNRPPRAIPPTSSAWPALRPMARHLAPP